MKNIFLLSDPSDNYSLKMIEIIKKSKLFKIKFIITTKKQKKKNS